MPRESLDSLFADFSKFARDIALVRRHGYRREAWTYARLRSVALKTAVLLKEHGVRTGDRVLLWGPNSPEWVAAFWGCLLRGAIVVPLDDSATPDFAARVANDAQAKLALMSRSKIEALPAMPGLVLEHFADSSFGEDVPRETSVIALAELSDEPITRKHIAQILYTSGTTAEPRGVVLSHGNFLANLEPLERGISEYRRYERWFHPLRFVSLVPLSHVFGQFMALFVPPLLGATVIFENSSRHTEMICTIKRERATALIAVPRMLDVLRSGLLLDWEAAGKSAKFAKKLERAAKQKFLRRAWRFRGIHRRFGWKFWAFISGGAALSRETETFFKRLGYAVVQGYGMTETASLISLNHPFRATEGSVGKILPGREFKLAEDGEILVRGENVSSGYWEHGQLRPAEDQGWLRTGDLGELDAEGNLRFRGRKKNVIVTPAGLNVYPEDLEAALRVLPGIRDCAVIPIQRDGNAEPCAVLLLEHPGEEAARALLDAANGRLAEYQRMRFWVVWPDPDFPRTATGKPRLSLIASRAADLLGGKAVATTAESLEGFLSCSADLSSLSSLDRVEVLSALEQRYNVELNETAFAEARTVADVRRLLERPSARRTDYVYPRWTQTPVVRCLRLFVYYLLVWPATQILAHPRTLGRHRLKDMRGPAIVVSNHITRRADIGLILAALPMRFRHRLAIAMGGETLQRMRKPPPGWFFLKRWGYQLGYFLVTALFNVFPLPQLSGFRESFRFAGESVDRGYSVLVFPEGVVNESEDGRMAPFQSGIGLLAENLALPVIPMRLDGVWKMKRAHRRLARLGEITVRIGAPVSFPAGTPPEEIAHRLESLVRSL
jgi:long-chain acyl-CoA synthetase